MRSRSGDVALHAERERARAGSGLLCRSKAGCEVGGQGNVEGGREPRVGLRCRSKAGCEVGEQGNVERERERAGLFAATAERAVRSGDMVLHVERERAPGFLLPQQSGR